MYPTGALVALDSLLNEKSVLLHNDESAYDVKEIKECKITKLDQEKLPVSPMSIPLSKGNTQMMYAKHYLYHHWLLFSDSPFHPLFDETLKHLQEKGAISQIVDSHTRESKQNFINCNTNPLKQTPLGLNHLFFPFLLLSAALCVCGIVLMWEKSFRPHIITEMSSYDSRLRTITKIISSPKFSSKDKMDQIEHYFHKRKDAYFRTATF